MKDKYGQVTNATFMSTKPKGVNLSRLLTYSSQETMTLQLSKIEASARSQHLLAGAHAVSGPGNVEIPQFPRCFYSNTCCWTVAVFVLQKCQTKRTFNMRHHKNTLFLPEEKLESLGHKAITETALEQPLRASKHFIPPQKWFPQSASNQQFPGRRIQSKMLPQRYRGISGYILKRLVVVSGCWIHYLTNLHTPEMKQHMRCSQSLWFSKRRLAKLVSSLSFCMVWCHPTFWMTTRHERKFWRDNLT